MSTYKPLPKSARKPMSAESKLRKMIRPLDPFFAPFIAVYNVLAPIPVIGPIVTWSVKIFVATGIVGGIVAFILFIMAAGALSAVFLSEISPSAVE